MLKAFEAVQAQLPLLHGKPQPTAAPQQYKHVTYKEVQLLMICCAKPLHKAAQPLLSA